MKFSICFTSLFGSSVRASVLAVLSLGSAAAATAPDTVGLDESLTLEQPATYVGVRTGLAIPTNANGDVLAVGPTLGVVLNEQNTVGLRVIWMDNPPDNPLATYTPPVPWAWGPVVDWQYHMLPDHSINFYFNGSAGFVYGIPSDVEEDNVILPILEGGFGARISKIVPSGRRIFMSPELGMVPGAIAPYVAMTFGVIKM